MNIIKRGLLLLYKDGADEFLDSAKEYVRDRIRPIDYYWYKSKLSPPSSPRVGQNRSDSDRVEYLNAVERALDTPEGFANFRRDPDYCRILEHVTKSQGKAYLNFINRENPELISRKNKWKRVGDVGNPIKYRYEGVGRVSPTTLRYLKVASDLKKYFGNDFGDKIAEIGGGYGGQSLIIDSLFQIEKYNIYDLPEVNKLISKFLESFILDSSYSVTTLNQSTTKEYDLVISNYAFSELPGELQRKYIKKVLSNSKRGYLTMNSGRGSKRDGEKLSIDELKKLLPPFDIAEEKPKTGSNNYIIIWDHS
jgi:putative sugar O-methyltransferase